MATIMVKVIFLFGLIVVAEISKSNAQPAAVLGKGEMLAKQMIASSRFKEFLKYNDLQIFINSYYGKLENGPAGIATFIHESAHVYDNMQSAGMRNVRYYWTDSSQLLKVNMASDYFPSDSILSVLPAYVKGKLLTQTYILCANNCSARIMGFYGLLEEFNAYSLEARSLVDMYGLFDTCSYLNTPAFWNGFLKSKYDSWTNFCYFNVFFASYLKYSSTNRVDFYNELGTDVGLKSAFYRIYSTYEESLFLLDTIENKVRAKLCFRGNMKYSYPFWQDYSTVRALARSDNTKRYLSVLLKH